MMCGRESCSRVIFSQKSPFAITVHTFGVRGNLDANDVWVEIMFQGDFLIKITLRSHRSRLWCGGNLDANDEWVGIMFQGDFFTKITLRFHRSRLWCEGNLCYGP